MKLYFKSSYWGSGACGGRGEREQIESTLQFGESLMTLKEKFGLFVDFEFLTEMGSWGTDFPLV